MVDRHADSFWAKVRKGSPDACWPWTGYKKSSGHGLTSYKNVPTHASRKAWILTHGIISSQLCVLHRCDVAACCNPSHMYLGTRAENMIDRWTNPAPGARGVGRMRVLNDAQLEKLWQMRRERATLQQCADKFGVHIATICRYITIVRKAKIAKLRTDRMSALA